MSVARTSSSAANAVTIRLTGAVTCCVAPASSVHLVRIERLSLPTGMPMFSAGHSSSPTARTVSYSAASSPGSPHAAIQLALSFTRAQFDRRGQQVGDGLAHRHAARGRRVQRGQRRALAHAHGLAAKARVVGQRDRAVGHRHLPRAHHRVAVAESTDGAVADRDEKALARHRGVAQHGEARVFELDVGEVERLRLRATRCTSRCILGGLPSSTSIGMSMARSPPGPSSSTSVRSSLATPTIAYGQRSRTHMASNSGSAVGVERDHVALLALVAPDLFGREAGFFERHLAQVERGALGGAVHQLGEGVADAAGAHVVDREDRVVLAKQPAVVDDLLRAALDLGVAALHRVEVERGGVAAGGHRARGAAAHADAHARAAELHQQRAGGELDLVCLRVA